jgi:predicted TIM-barrel fold metal-dependent hydrolase
MSGGEMSQSEFKTLENPLLKNVGPIAERHAQAPRGVADSAGIEVFSADGHWEITEDIFYEGFPVALKEKAPRVWFDRYWHVGFPGGMESVGGKGNFDRIMERISPPSWNVDYRLRCLRTEGIQKEIVFPQSLLALIRYPDLEVQEWMYRIYNEYMAATSRSNQGVIYGVGVLSNWWDPSKWEHAARQIVELGLKTFMIPASPGKAINGKSIHYGDAFMEPFWDAIAATDLPVNFHVGENPDFEHRGGMGTNAVVTLGSFRRPLAELIFGGVFDRHPELQIVFSEGGLAWIPPTLQDAEMIFDSYGNGDVLDRINHRPSYYWHNNCYATFQQDRLGLAQLDYIGADRVMWGSDFPHDEGTFGVGWDSIDAIIDATSIDVARKILGGTAKKVYRL